PLRSSVPFPDNNELRSPAIRELRTHRKQKCNLRTTRRLTNNRFAWRVQVLHGRPSQSEYGCAVGHILGKQFLSIFPRAPLVLATQSESCGTFKVRVLTNPRKSVKSNSRIARNKAPKERIIYDSSEFNSGAGLFIGDRRLYEQFIHSGNPPYGRPRQWLLPQAVGSGRSLGFRTANAT